MRKRIGIDARLWRQTGVGVYLRNFFYHLPPTIHQKYEVAVYLLENDAKDFKSKYNNSFTINTVSSRWHTFSEQSRFLLKLLDDKLDLMHFTYFSYPVLYRKPFISTIHDLTPLLYKTGKASTKNSLQYIIKHQALNVVLSEQIKNAAAIITPTKTVKEQIIEIFPTTLKDKIYPIYEGVNYELKMVQKTEPVRLTVPNKFFLYVGNFYPHKNVEKLIQIFKQISDEYGLVMAGPEDYFTEHIRKQIKANNLDYKVQIITGTTLSDLSYLYKHAVALIHPALAEGFGLSLIEAVYYNLPIIASDIPVFRELWGDNYISFDPNSLTAIAGAVSKFISTPPVVDYSKILPKYSFSEMTNKIVDIYDRCA